MSPIMAERLWGTSLSQFLSHPCPHIHVSPCIHAHAAPIPVPLASLFPSPTPLVMSSLSQPHSCAIPSPFNATLSPCCCHPCAIPDHTSKLSP